MKIGIYGGSFNPLHNGHIRLINSAINELSLDKLIVVPCYIQPFKQEISYNNSKERLDMLYNTLISPKIEISSFEIDEKDVSYTYETLDHFKSIFPDDELIFILGTDSFLKIITWTKGEYLLKNYSFAIANRPGYDMDILQNMIVEYKNKYDTNIYVIKEEMPYLSSTEIRYRIKNGLDVSNLIPSEVNNYILKNGLYKD